MSETKKDIGFGVNLVSLKFCFALALTCGALFICFKTQSPSYLLVLSRQESTLAIVDPPEMKVMGKVPTGDNPHEIVVSTD